MLRTRVSRDNRFLIGFEHLTTAAVLLENARIHHTHIHTAAVQYIMREMCNLISDDDR